MDEKKKTKKHSYYPDMISEKAKDFSGREFHHLQILYDDESGFTSSNVILYQESRSGDSAIVIGIYQLDHLIAQLTELRGEIFRKKSLEGR